MATDYEEDSQFPPQQNADRSAFPYRALAMVLITIAIICVIIAGWMLAGNKHSDDSGYGETPVLATTSAAPSDTGSSSAPEAAAASNTEAKPAGDHKDTSIVVLNNSKVHGLANKLTARLKHDGWTRLAAPGNCSQSTCGSLPKTMVFYRDSAAKPAAEAAAALLGAKVQTAPDFLRNRSEKIIVVAAA